MTHDALSGSLVASAIGQARVRCRLAEGVPPRLVRDVLAPGRSVPRTAEAWRRRFAQAGLAGAALDRCLASLARANVAAELEHCRRTGSRIIAAEDADWPWMLRLDSDPPTELWIAGSHPPAQPAVAIVGSRQPSEAGLAFASDVARAVANANCLVVSGGALGIDAAAHQAALDAGGTTSIVLGSGIGRPSPTSNIPLFDAVRTAGHAIISEWPTFAPPRPWRFPRRNRVIAGLSLAVVVVEAGPRSGSLITARYASDLGREVLVMPGPADDPRVNGSHRLIREGATLVRNAQDVLEAIATCGPLASAAAALANPPGGDSGASDSNRSQSPAGSRNQSRGCAALPPSPHQRD
ncbi:MAG: DNA-processing protein DprA [Phycisphaerales bacterium]